VSAWAVLLLTLFVVPLVVNEAGELAPWLAGRMVQWGASLLGTPEARKRYAEEWAANLERVPGKLTKLAWACGLLLWGAPRMRVQIRSREQPAARSQPEARAGRISFRSFRTRGYNLLIALAGVRRDILDLLPSERARFQSLGSAMLIANGTAMISMWFALSSALGMNGILAVPVAALWGLVTTGIDRWLITSIPTSYRGESPIRVALIVVPRLLLAILFGTLISAPLVLRILQGQIDPASGLLARLRVLGSLPSHDLVFSASCVLLFLLFLFIGCLPITLRLMQLPGEYEEAVMHFRREEQ